MADNRCLRIGFRSKIRSESNLFNLFEFRYKCDKSLKLMSSLIPLSLVEFALVRLRGFCNSDLVGAMSPCYVRGCVVRIGLLVGPDIVAKIADGRRTSHN